jgi:hypothetical protein
MRPTKFSSLSKIFSLFISTWVLVSCSTGQMKIVVPKGFTGEVYLVLSTLDTNMLNIDSNGIGYINKETFNKTTAKPMIFESDGTDISKHAVGFSPSAFWSKGKYAFIDMASKQANKEIQFLSFWVSDGSKDDIKLRNSIELNELVDHRKILYR